jgi:hypothetical protein
MSARYWKRIWDGVQKGLVIKFPKCWKVIIPLKNLETLLRRLFQLTIDQLLDSLTDEEVASMAGSCG